MLVMKFDKERECAQSAQMDKDASPVVGAFSGKSSQSFNAVSYGCYFK